MRISEDDMDVLCEAVALTTRLLLEEITKRKLSKENLENITDYVSENFPDMLERKGFVGFVGK